MHSTYQNYRGTTGKPMLTHYLKLIVTQLPAALLASLTLLIFTIQPAHADFRKALTAYQARDGQTMLKEVQDAVDKKNDDGLILFLSVLGVDATLARNRNYTEQSFENPPAPWQVILDKSNSEQLRLLLKMAVYRSSLEAQFKLNALFEASDWEYREEYIKVDDELRKKGYGASKAQEMFSLASDYFIGSKKKFTQYGIRDAKIIKRNVPKALSLIKQAIAQPDSSLYLWMVSDELSQYYYEQYLSKKHINDLKQAYLWALTPSPETNYLVLVLKKMQKDGNLEKIAPELSSAWRKAVISINKLEYERSASTTLQNRQYEDMVFPYELAYQFEQPALIKKYQKINLNIQPVFSFHRYIDADYASATNYLIDIYADGRVYFSLGGRRQQNQEVLLRVSSDEVDKLLLEIRAIGFEGLPTFNVLKNKTDSQICEYNDCGTTLIEKMGFWLDRYYLTLRDNKNQKILSVIRIRYDEYPLFLTKIFSLIENKIPTHQYRCGTDKKHIYYQYCIDFDNKFIETANQGEIK